VLGLIWRFLTQSLDLTSIAKDITSATILLVVLFLGAARYQSNLVVFDAFDLGWYNDRAYETLVTGWVTAPPDLRDNYANLRVRATGIDTGDGADLKVDGLLLARVDPNEDFHYGDIIRLRGTLQTPADDEEFSYRDYLQRQNVYSIMTSAEVTRLPGWAGNPIWQKLYAFKDHALETVYQLFPDPEASLLAGILLGVDNGLPSELQQSFKDTGTSHIIAISGFNIAIIAGIFISIFGRLFGERRGAVFAALGIIFYTLLVGAEAAVVRAAVMGLTALLARHFGRRQDGLVTLFGVAALMNLFNPYYLQDVGFQLSFAATLGLILYAQPLEALAKRSLSFFNLSSETAEKSASLISNFFLLTLAAQITTLPIMAYHFNRLSLISFIANPFILPPQPAVMIIGGLAVILGMAFLPLGQVVAFAAWPFVAYTIRMVEFFAGMPAAAVSVDFPLWGVVLWYVVILGLTFGLTPLKEFYVSLKTRLPKIPVWAAIGALTLLAILVWRSVMFLPDGKLHITFLDVQTSDAILIETPAGDTILINGGESLSQVSSQLGQRLPLFNRKLDWLIVASTQENEVASLPRLMERYKPGQVLWAGNVEASFPARTLNEWLTSHQVRVTRAEKDQVLDLGDGATLTVLSADERGAVLLLKYGNFRMLLPVGMSLDTLAKLQADPSLPPLTALLLADSGMAQLNSADWINFLNPQLVILSVAADNFRGLPGDDTLAAVGERTLLRTDVNGWIEVASDGQSIWAEVQNELPALPPTPLVTASPAVTEAPLSTEEPIGTEEPFSSTGSSTGLTEQPDKRFDIPTEGFPSIGADDALITIVQFGDYQCPFCQRWHTQVYQQLMDDYSGQIRLVYRNLPLTLIHPQAMNAAEAALCAGDQDAYWQYHDMLFENSDTLNDDIYVSIAVNMGLDTSAFESCMLEHKYKASIEADMKFATDLGVQSTPTFFINGLAVVGAQPLDVFRQMIDDELAGKIP
jgi:competence protein ComEC